MRTLIYKRTHSGDPDPKTGVFGCNNCMGTVRGRGFDAVIGIGGISQEPVAEGIAAKLTWIGIGKHETISDPSRPFVTPSSPLVTFDHFRYYGEHGPLLKNIAPKLARRMLYDKNVRTRCAVAPIMRRTDDRSCTGEAADRRPQCLKCLETLQSA